MKGLALSPELEDLALVFRGLGAPERVAPLFGDGSARRFFRVWAAGGTFVLLQGPDPAENAAYVRVGRHLAARGVRVPAIYGVDEARGWVLLEDLGDRSLLAALRGCRGGAEVLALYGPVLDLLVQAQVGGAEGFDLAVGFAPESYGGRTMVDAEGLYFVREFALGVLGVKAPEGLGAEFGRLAREGEEAPRHWLLHRDFQSRNVHIKDGKPFLIDFQGARPGPLAYDAAALLLDPYAAHPAARRERLREEYLARLRRRGVDPGEVEGSWFALGAFRLLQALGAYGKLGGRLGKRGFLEHADAALDHLTEHLAARAPREFPRLWDLVRRCRDRWAEVGPSLLAGRGGAQDA